MMPVFVGLLAVVCVFAGFVWLGYSCGKEIERVGNTLLKERV